MNKQNIIKHIHKNYSVDILSIETIAEGVSDSFVLTSLQGKYILKCIPRSFEQTVLNSLDVLRYLEHHNFSSPKVVKTQSNEMFSVILVDSIAVLYHYTEGTDQGEHVDYVKLGQLVGKLHSLMVPYQGKLKTRDKDYYINRYIQILHEKKYSSEKINDYIRLGDLLWNKVNQLPRSYSHGDLHKGNVIKDLEGNYQLLDFDTSAYGFSVYDVMLICNSTNYFNFEENSFKQTITNFKLFNKGYQLFDVLSEDQIESFYYFMGIYHFQLQATIIEIHGINCIDHIFIDKQYEWLTKWQSMCKKHIGICFE